MMAQASEHCLRRSVILRTPSSQGMLNLRAQATAAVDETRLSGRGPALPSCGAVFAFATVPQLQFVSRARGARPADDD